MKTKRLAGVLALSIDLAGCTTLSTMPYTPEAVEARPVRPGDRVVLSTKAPFSTHAFVVTSVTSEEICGKDECVRTGDISWVERREFSALRTTALVAGVALVAVGLHSMSPLVGMQISSFR